MHRITTLQRDTVKECPLRDPSLQEADGGAKQYLHHQATRSVRGRSARPRANHLGHPRHELHATRFTKGNQQCGEDRADRDSRHHHILQHAMCCRILALD